MAAKACMGVSLVEMALLKGDEASACISASAGSWRGDGVAVRT
jgi:hypothetical protein